MYRTTGRRQWGQGATIGEALAAKKFGQESDAALRQVYIDDAQAMPEMVFGDLYVELEDEARVDRAIALTRR